MLRYCICFGMLLWPALVQAQDMARIKKNIDTLCSPAMHGRGYVNKGDLVAASFIGEQFRQMGLKSFGTTFLQYFPLDINTFPKKVKLQIDKQTLTPGKDYIVNPVSAKGKGSGKIVYLDTLIFTQEQARQKFLQTDFRKNILVYQSKHQNKLLELPGEYLNKMHEARALIELHPEKLTASLSNKQQSHPAFEMVSKTLPSNASKAKFRLDATLISNYQSQNVIGYISGKTRPDSFIVVSAHYDHLGRMGNKTYFPGANDNASGTSMLLELAHYYSLPENQPEYSMAFIAFGAEEAGLIGSRYYTQHPLFPLAEIKFMINLDLVGTGDDGITVVNSVALPREFNLLTQINQEKGYVSKVNKRANAPNSDHYFFVSKGVKAVFIYTLGGIKAYHDVYDRPETLPLTKYTQLFGLLTDFIRVL
ncbi:M28 family peptidase [Rhodocytophaga rosea]|uniref:M28 family peptidase n=1 Tax=Rhodocytophaga rosea TaxID=2704465 RepID=A0A6C0GNA8_9BACT|nr:M28 family peptidase [Rhodocytophaga rosea]QHT69113.1 M28 family peptidase [Rhodocytophaga rosea]